MKRSEIAMIVLIASFSMMVTFALAQSLLGDKVKRTAQVEHAVKVSESIDEPSQRIFNSTAINPTIEVCVEKDSDDQTAASGCNEDESLDLESTDETESVPEDSSETTGN